MMQQTLIEQTQNYVKQLLANDCTGHDWGHIYRVWKTASHIAEKENADLFIVQLAALLHDIDDWKLQKNPLENNAQRARDWLRSLELESHVINQICEIIHHLSFQGANVASSINTLEGRIVQDADRLDAMGAIGIARTFAYGGHKGRLLYDPDVPHAIHNSFEEYKNHQGTTINHFFEKLLLLKDRMNTETGRQLAEQRHQFMELFLERFFLEWKGIE